MSSPQPADLLHKVALSFMRGVTVKVAAHIVELCGSEREFFEASESSLRGLGLTMPLASAHNRAEALEKASAELRFIEKNSINVLYYSDEGYPQRLSAIDDAPLLMYALGGTDLNRGRMLSIVGTRNATAYGIDFTTQLVEDLAERMAEPLTVVSGLAFGIDGAAHRAALKAGLPTVGVLAHGLDTIYPAQHRSLAATMARGEGMLLTEYHHLSAVHKGNFLARNRIVASLCDALVVSESATKGGALVTARLACDYNRSVFALPGRISDRYSGGCNELILRGKAQMVRDASDIIEAMQWPVKSDRPVQPTLFPEVTADEQRVIDILRQEGEAHVTALTSRLAMPPHRVTALLIEMEFKGLLLAFPGGNYRLK